MSVKHLCRANPIKRADTRLQIKVETALFYQACDEIGLLLFQDMPSLRPLQQRTLANCTVVDILPDAAQQDEFARQLDLLIIQQRPFPSIVTWVWHITKHSCKTMTNLLPIAPQVIYNEGWGQLTNYYPEFALTDRVRQLDPTRLIDSTTGWYDHGAGDFSVRHPSTCDSSYESYLPCLGQPPLR